MKRRELLGKALATGAVVWSAPEIISSTRAVASASTLPVPKTGTSSLWKWSSNPPTVADVCTTGPVGTANRGSAVFTVDCAANPITVSVTITVVSGPALSGANAREVKILQSSSAGSCLTQSGVGTYDSANGVAVTLGPTPVTTGATSFSMVMLQTGGGGTDTYTTNRVNIAC